MTDKIQQARRAAFEEWWYNTDVLDMNKIELAEAAFNAALDCFVIELPDHGLMPGFAVSDYDMGFKIGQRTLIDDCRSSIESTSLGLRIK